MSPKILLATRNPGKIKEMRQLLAGADFELITLDARQIDYEVPETGATYTENAVAKAREYADLAGIPALSDDSGLDVDALGGAPGVYSARYSPKPGATDADRRKYLLSQLEPHPRPWTARFHCVAVVAMPGGTWITAEGICEGVIVPVERGTNGFGYDPVFAFPSGLTMAELSDEEKNRVSHRALAVRSLLGKLRDFLAFLE